MWAGHQCWTRIRIVLHQHESTPTWFWLSCGILWHIYWAAMLGNPWGQWPQRLFNSLLAQLSWQANDLMSGLCKRLPVAVGNGRNSHWSCDPTMHCILPRIHYSIIIPQSIFRLAYHVVSWQHQSNATHILYRADSRLVPSQWETALLCNEVSHWLDANLELALLNIACWQSSQ